MAYVSTDAVAGIASGDLFVRVYLLVPEGEELVNLNFFFAGEFMTFSGLLVGLRNDEVFVRTLPAGSSLESNAIPRGRWICLEARTTMNDFDRGSAELWLDGESLSENTGLTNLPSSPFSAFTLGIPLSQPTQPPVELFVDEVVINIERIGCD